MKSTWWKKKIRQCCKDAGTYEPFFESIIETLAKLMETRDEAQKKYEEEGRQPIVTYINKNGAENSAKNPLLLIILDCDAQALNYWRDLGLTAKSWRDLKKKEGASSSSGDGIADALAELGL